jgi:hypothetical protein
MRLRSFRESCQVMRVENRSDQVCSDLPLTRFCTTSHPELLCLPYSMARQIQQLVKILSKGKREGEAVCYPIPDGGPHPKKYLLRCPGLCWPWVGLSSRCILCDLAVRTRFVIRRRCKRFMLMVGVRSGLAKMISQLWARPALWGNRSGNSAAELVVFVGESSKSALCKSFRGYMPRPSNEKSGRSAV